MEIATCQKEPRWFWNKQKQEYDIPDTIWEFIHDDWKMHLDSHKVDLPDLYHLFIDGFLPPEKKPKKPKRSVSEQDLDDIKQKINGDSRNDLIENIKYEKFMIEDDIDAKKIKTVPENYLEQIKEDKFENNKDLLEMKVNDIKEKILEAETGIKESEEIYVIEKKEAKEIEDAKRILSKILLDDIKADGKSKRCFETLETSSKR